MNPQSRRKFLENTITLSASSFLLPIQNKLNATGNYSGPGQPIAVSTWDFGFNANAIAWKYLSENGRALDAVEHGIRIVEADVDNLSVGIGGLPDRDGFVTLDACIMDEKGQAGSVTFLRDIAHPISVARLIMEKTPHVMLSGDGALQFALDNGFERQNLLTEKARLAWEAWKVESHYKPIINIENHDTVGLLVLDQRGDIAGGCSTSGLAYKMHGRVGDSPIIGAGLYVDNEVGAAVATGLGELVMRTLSAFLVVELMRNGLSPQEACQEAIRRIAKKNPEVNDYQVGLLALSKTGLTGAFALQEGFRYAFRDESTNEVRNSSSYI